MKEIFTRIVERIKQIILKPRETWDIIKSEETTETKLFTEYLLILAALPALSLFIGKWIVGLQVGHIFPFVATYRFSFWASLITAIFWYALTVCSIWLAGKAISYLAPKFDSTKNDLNGLKLAVYASTPILVAGILRIIPNLDFLVFVLGLWGFVLLYFGLPALMETPKDKNLPYFIVSILVFICINIVLSAIISLISFIFGPNLPRM